MDELREVRRQDRGAYPDDAGSGSVPAGVGATAGFTDTASPTAGASARDSIRRSSIAQGVHGSGHAGSDQGS